MKELTIEQKAKRYDETIELAKSWYVDSQIDFKKSLETLFPELKELEDGKMKKIISDILLIDSDEIREILDANNVLMQDIDAWLEKQDYTFEIKAGHWYKCVCDYVLNSSDLMFKNDRLYYCRRDWRLKGEIDERNVKDIGVNGYKSFFRPATNQEIKEWLEKQGSQNPADKVVPKYNVADWLVHNERKHILKVVNRTPFFYKVVDILGYHNTIINDAIENNYHLWTIKDANDGDVLAIEPIEGYYSPFVAICKKQNEEDFDSYCFIGFDGKFYKGENGHSTVEVHPATKEQRDLLFAKMKEAGYEWDAEKKELKKIEQTSTWSEEDELHIKELESLVKQVWATAEHKNDKDTIHKMSDLSFFLKTLKPKSKQEWSEEDDYNLQCCIAKVQSDIDNGRIGRNSELLTWLNSLKERVHLEQEWSEEDDFMVTTVENSFYLHCGQMTDRLSEQYKKFFEKVKSIKDRVQPRKEWSEEDEKHSSYICAALDCYYRLREDRNNTNGQEDLDKARNWLHNKLKSLRPQNTWKPSEEQLEAIKRASGGSRAIAGDDYLIMESLYNDLRKLMNE